MAKEKKSTLTQWIVIFVVLFGLFLVSSFFALIISLSSSEQLNDGNVMIIPINGPIMTYDSDSIFSEPVASSKSIVELIEKAESDESIKAVIFEINSPGGTPVASHEVVKAIKDMNKPNVALIREVGASGAYWIASATNHIISDELSVTGSVGVFSSYVELSGLLKDYNVTYQRLVGGEFKDIGSPFKELTTSERDELQRKITMMHNYFLQDVVESRSLNFQQESEIKTGIFFIGLESIDLGLIDGFGGMNEAKEYISKQINENVTLVRISSDKSLFEILSGLSSQHGYQVGKGIGKSMFETSNQGILLE